MLAYHNDPQLKQQILEQLQRHYDADEIVKGQYWENGKGCAVGCTLHTNQHREYESRFGIPVRLAYLEDVIFEGLPNEEAKTWPIRFMSAINVGADLSTVWRDFVVWMLIDPVDGVIQYTTPGTEVYEVIIRVANLYQDGYTQQQMLEAHAAALAADTARAAKAAMNATYKAARAAVKSVAFAAGTADYAAYADYAAHAAVNAYASVSDDPTDCFFNNPDAFYIKMANKLIDLLQKQEVKNVSLP